MYLLIVRYGDDAERKRLEYILERFRERIRAVKPSGAVWIIDGSPRDVEVFMEELLARVPRDRVELYKLEEPDLRVEERKSRIEVETGMSEGEALGAVGLVIARLRGALLSEIGGVREYVLRPRGGYARVRVKVLPRSEGSVVRIDVSGYGSGFYRIINNLLDELSLLGVVRRVD